MKKTLFVLILFFSLFSLFALEGLNTLGQDSRVITAFKRRLDGQVPAQEVQFRLLDPNNIEYGDNYKINLPLNARNNEYTAFSWVLSGNIYHVVTINFTLKPMYLEGNASSNQIIPYEVSLNHSQTRIGNTPIAVGAPSQSVSYFTNNFTTNRYKYADNVTITGKKTVNNASVNMTVVYNMSTHTKVYNSNGTEISYSLSVCDYWNRYGSAVVKMQITQDGKKLNSSTKFADGVYYANVIAEVIIN